MPSRRPTAPETSPPSRASAAVVWTAARAGCDLFTSTFRGRELLYPGPFGEITAGADKDYPVDYSHLNIKGYAFGAEGLQGVIPNRATLSRGQHGDRVRLGPRRSR